MNAQAQETRVRVPPYLVTSANCLAITSSNAFRFPSGVSVSEGDVLVFDLEKSPKHGDVVMMLPPEGEAIVRECYIGAGPKNGAGKFGMGILDDDGESVHMIELSRFKAVGVLNGKVPRDVQPPKQAARRARRTK